MPHPDFGEKEKFGVFLPVFQAQHGSLPLSERSGAYEVAWKTRVTSWQSLLSKSSAHADTHVATARTSVDGVLTSTLPGVMPPSNTDGTLTFYGSVLHTGTPNRMNIHPQL